MKLFHNRIREWYAAHGRKDLPWRNTPDPYAIYLSETMLQQTQVKTVLTRYYAPFLKRFPTIAALAAASQDEVLQSWQGLGYYNRAINLHKAAKLAGSALPDTIEGLLALPGIGRNTAHAVAAFAFHQPVAIMEANVKRVVSRIFALERPSDAELWEKATSLLDTKHPFDYNQAMMDIGALVCLKRKPLCSECPANIICKGKHAPELYPAPKLKKATPVREKNIVIWRNGNGHFHAVARISRFLNGLYHFKEADKAGDTRDLTKAVALGSVRQQYSHFTLEADVFLVDVDTLYDEGWYDFDRLKRLPMSMAEQKILKKLANYNMSSS